jgi:hypothetical protein
MIFFFSIRFLLFGIAGSDNFGERSQIQCVIRKGIIIVIIIYHHDSIGLQVLNDCIIYILYIHAPRSKRTS